MIQVKGKTNGKINEITGKAIKGKEAIREATSDFPYSTGLPTIGAIDYVNNHRLCAGKRLGEINYSTPTTKLQDPFYNKQQIKTQGHVPHLQSEN